MTHAWYCDKLTGRWGGWVRFAGKYGIHISNRRYCDAFFSERYGYRKAWYVFGIRIELLGVKSNGT